MTVITVDTKNGIRYQVLKPLGLPIRHKVGSRVTKNFRTIEEASYVGAKWLDNNLQKRWTECQSQ